MFGLGDFEAVVWAIVIDRTKADEVATGHQSAAYVSVKVAY